MSCGMCERYETTATDYSSSVTVIAALAVLGHVYATGVDNGFVSFSQQQVVDVEPDEGSKAIVLPMQRTGGTTGTITVFVSVS